MASVLVLEPLDCHEFLSTLRDFQNLLMTCVGPEGGIKLIISPAGFNTVTSASHRLLDNIPLNHPVCAYISQVMRQCTDCGLYMGVVVTSLLESSLSNQLNISARAVRDIVQDLFSMLLHLFNAPSVKLKVNFDTVRQLLPVSRSILTTKPACGLTKAEIVGLNICIVKAFLQTIGETMGQVIIECKEGSSIPNKVYAGVLYHKGLDESILTILTKKFTAKGCFSLLLFTIMLTDESEPEQGKSGRIELDSDSKNTNKTVEQAQRLLEKVAELNVDIVVCQKVVHPSLALYLQRKGILLLQRLGTDLAQAVEKMSHAIPIASVIVEDLRPMLGSVEAVRLVDGTYILLEKKGGDVATILAACPNEEAASELKMDQEADKFDCSRAELNACVSFIQRALLSATALKGKELVVDSVFGHGWLLESDMCFCGMVSRENVMEKNGKWGQTVGTNIPSLLENTVVDLHQNKMNAMKLAIEVYANILEIGMVVYVP